MAIQVSFPILVEYSRSVELLFKDLKSFKVLSKEEEISLYEKAKLGSIQAKNKLIYSNIKYAVSVAKKYNTPGYPIEDLISEAIMGLLEAFDTYDTSKNVRFITYAKWYIIDNLSKVQLKLITRPDKYRAKRRLINETNIRLEQEISGDVPRWLLAEKTNLDESFLNNTMYTMHSIDNQENNMGLEIEDLLNEKFMFAIEPTVMEIFEQLPEKHQYIVGWKSGMFGPCKSSKSLALELKMSSEEVDETYRLCLKQIKENYI